ncbi:MAG TPA: isoprenylcysteine carboxylmethyltransferase family protein [Candidatus Acidoferrales bacterium]|nr:isoprenylcysteine carboxylmethyltransferase family protein [Candidatus Acidoferrales bacterium]
MKGIVLLACITVQRAVELVMASRNTRELRRRGAYEVGAAHYPAIVALHAAWLVVLWWRGRRRPVSWPLLGLFALLQVGRAWVLVTLRGRWTTRILVLPGERAIERGPYRFLRHPNYLIVALELPAVALALGMVRSALLFGGANLALLAWRIRCEDEAWHAAPGFDEATALGGDGVSPA